MQVGFGDSEDKWRLMFQVRNLFDESFPAAIANGGRQIPAHGGNIFDHMSVTYEFKGGRFGFVQRRHAAGPPARAVLAVGP